MNGTRRYRTLRQLLTAAMLACAGAAAADDPASAARCAGKVPAELAAPPRNTLVAALDATGVQIYECTKGAWTLKGPEANLVDKGRQVGHHYLGPTWEAQDGSKVKGTKVAAASVDATAVPWLLLKGEPSGSGRFAEVTFIQRVNTAGGQPPQGACTASDKPTSVPYTATYCFYAAAVKR